MKLFSVKLLWLLTIAITLLFLYQLSILISIKVDDEICFDKSDYYQRHQSFEIWQSFLETKQHLIDKAQKQFNMIARMIQPCELIQKFENYLGRRKQDTMLVTKELDLIFQWLHAQKRCRPFKYLYLPCPDSSCPNMQERTNYVVKSLSVSTVVEKTTFNNACKDFVLKLHSSYLDKVRQELEKSQVCDSQRNSLSILAKSSMNFMTIQYQHHMDVPGLSRRTIIAILQPVTSHKINVTSVDELPALRVWLCAMLQTIEPEWFEYWIYYGFDETDSWYNQNKFLKAVNKIIEQAHLSDTVFLRFIPLENSRYSGKITSIWNRLAKEAYEDGCEYFLPSNDDARLLSPGWSSLAVSTLLNSPLYPNLGLVAFNDVGYSGFPTFHLVHKTHLDIFRQYYNVDWEGAYQDPFAFEVYASFNSSFLLMDILIENHIGTLPRYDYGTAPSFGEQRERHKQHLLEWLISKSPLLSLSFDSLVSCFIV